MRNESSHLTLLGNHCTIAFLMVHYFGEFISVFRPMMLLHCWPIDRSSLGLSVCLLHYILWPNVVARPPVAADLSDPIPVPGAGPERIPVCIPDFARFGAGF